MPAILKIILVFVGMLAMTRVRIPLGAALLLGGIALNLWGEAAVHVGANLGRAVVSTDLWLLVAVTVLIIELGRFMTAGGNAEQIVAATRRWGGRHGDAWSVMALPAMIGLVPMPGGALFSAPFVEQSARERAGSAEWKSAVNYWFRHVWEYWWPLYPGVIVAMSLFALEAWQFMAVQVLFTPVAVAAGYVFLVRPHVAGLRAVKEAPDHRSRGVWILFLPLVIVIVSVLVLPPVLRGVLPTMESQRVKLVAVLVGLVAGLLVVACKCVGSRTAGADTDRHRMFGALFTRKSASVLGSLAGVLIFKSMLESSGLLPAAADELSRSGLPMVWLVAALPFLAGIVTGLAVGFVGTSFPLVVGLLEAEALGLSPVATLVLAYGFGYMGMMLSPIHLCLLLTRDYFAAGLPSIYRRLLPCIATVLVYTVAVTLVLAWVT